MNLKRRIDNIKYKMHRRAYLKSLWSPFKRFKLKWYAGKIKHGVPYFYPRKWVPLTQEDIERKAREYVNDPKKVKKTFEEWCDYFKGHKKSVDKKIGFDFLSLGWKTKFDQYRFEWAPMASFVFFKWQICVWAVAPHQDHYWECWLYYEYRTDKKLSKKERIAQCRREYPQIWTRHFKDQKETIDYYDVVLKKKYLHDKK